MHKLAIFTTISALALSGCGKDDKAVAPLITQGVTPIAAQDASAIELVATHAFETPAPIANIAFTPNDVASWLGVIGMLSTDGHFYTSSVEGDKVRAISLDKHIDIIGLNRPKAPGMFLTLLEGGSLRAYIESDDNAGFTALPLKGDAQKVLKLCASAELTTGKSPVYAITASGDIKSYMVTSDQDNFSLTDVPLTAGEAAGKAFSPADLCAASTADLTPLSRNEAALTAMINQTARNDNTSDFSSFGGSTGLSAVVKSDLYTQRGAHHIAVESELNTVFAVYKASQRVRLHNFTIEQGLSISGLNRARAIASTSSPFGGSGFNDGIIALADAEDDRIVIVSRSYLIDQLTAAEEPPTSE